MMRRILSWQAEEGSQVLTLALLLGIGLLLELPRVLLLLEIVLAPVLLLLASAVASCCR